jgi:hypothetical protein
MRAVPFNQRPLIRQYWANSFPPEERAEQTSLLEKIEREDLAHQMREVPMDQRGKMRQEFANAFPPEERAEKFHLLLEAECQDLAHQMRALIPTNSPNGGSACGGASIRG